MSYLKLQQASELYMKLNAVNEQISGLEAVAMQVLDGSPEVSLSLSILSAKEFESKVPEPDEVDTYFDDIAEHIREHMGGIPYSKSCTSNRVKPVNKPAVFYQSLSDVVTLQILNMVMVEKKQVRRVIVDQIKGLNLV